MDGFLAQRDVVMRGADSRRHLDTTQLTKHAFGLATQARKSGKRPVLVYLHAEPEAWPDGTVISSDRILAHRAERDSFTTAVSGDFVAFQAIDYRTVLSNLSGCGDRRIRDHVDRVIDRFAPL